MQLSVMMMLSGQSTWNKPKMEKRKSVFRCDTKVCVKIEVVESEKRSKSDRWSNGGGKESERMVKQRLDGGDCGQLEEEWR